MVLRVVYYTKLMDLWMSSLSIQSKLIYTGTKGTAPSVRSTDVRVRRGPFHCTVKVAAIQGLSNCYAMFTLYHEPHENHTRRPIGPLSTHKDGDGAIYVTERSCAALNSKAERHISERFCANCGAA